MEGFGLPDSADILNEVEAAFPVDQWTVGGIRMWPALRIRYWECLVAGRPGLDGRRTETRQLGRRLAQLAAGPARRSIANLLDHSRRAHLASPANVVLLSGGRSLANVAGAWFERFCDPLIAEFARRHLRTLLLTPLHDYRTPRSSASAFIQPELDRCDVRSVLSLAQLPEGLPEYEAFTRWATGVGAPAPGREWLRFAAKRIRHTADYFGRILQATKASLGGVVNYYSLQGMAFVLACHEWGLPVVDIQHGVAGNLHPGYGQWTRVPSDGFELLPSYFWCWTKEDAAAITRWAPKAVHRALPGGHIWLRHWRENPALYREDDERIRSVKSQHPECTHVLVTLQQPLSADPTRRLITVIRKAPSDLFWWVRLHPGQLAERKAIAMMLESTQTEIDLATSAQLPDLLRHVQVHVTHNSSSILEAAWMGIPSVSCSVDCGEIYPQQKRSGWLVEADFGELPAALRFQATRAPALRLEPPDHGSFEAAIQELLRAGQLENVNPPGAVVNSR